MGHLWSLPLPLLLFYCWGVVATKSSTGPKTSMPGTLVPTNDTEILVVSPGFGTSSEEDVWSHKLMETTSTGHRPLQEPTLTSLQNSVLVSPSQETEAREAETSFVLEDKALTKVTPSKFSGVTAAARSTVPGSDSHEESFHILCTEDISEEVRIGADVSALAPTSAKAQGNSVSSESWGPADPNVQPPDLSSPARALAASIIVHEVMTHCKIDIEAEKLQRITSPGPSPSEGREDWSAPETLGTLSTNPLKEITDSVESPSLTEVSGAVDFSPETGTTLAKATSPAGSSATMVYGLTWGDRPLSSRSPRNSSPNSVPKDMSPLPSDPQMVALNSPEPTPSKSIVSVNPWGPSSTVGRQPEPAVPTSASGKLTPAVSSGEDAGFLLLRLSVVSQDNLLDPRVAEKLMQQLRCELHTHMLLTEVSLLRVTRS